MLSPKFDSFEKLPSWVKDSILQFCSADGQNWALKPIPALNGHSFLTMMNEEDGELKARHYFERVKDGFPTGD